MEALPAQLHQRKGTAADLFKVRHCTDQSPDQSVRCRQSQQTLGHQMAFNKTKAVLLFHHDNISVVMVPFWRGEIVGDEPTLLITHSAVNPLMEAVISERRLLVTHGGFEQSTQDLRGKMN